MKTKPILIATLIAITFFSGCTRSGVFNEDTTISTENIKEGHVPETTTIIGTLVPGEIEATVYAWNEQFTSEPVAVHEKEGTFTLILPALDYYHLSISFVSPTTGNIETFIHPKVMVTPNSITDIGIINLP